jgi:hypothetical protein
VSETETRCVVLGMSPAQVREVVGAPRGARRLGGGSALRWHFDRLLVTVSRRYNLVTRIRTLYPGAHTTDGVAVGDRVADLALRLDRDAWTCARSRRAQTCTSAGFFTTTQIRAVGGRVAWIELRLDEELLDLL